MQLPQSFESIYKFRENIQNVLFEGVVRFDRSRGVGADFLTVKIDAVPVPLHVPIS